MYGTLFICQTEIGWTFEVADQIHGSLIKQMDMKISTLKSFNPPSIVQNSCDMGQKLTH